MLFVRSTEDELRVQNVRRLVSEGRLRLALSFCEKFGVGLSSADSNLRGAATTVVVQQSNEFWDFRFVPGSFFCSEQHEEGGTSPFIIGHAMTAMGRPMFETLNTSVMRNATNALF